MILGMGGGGAVADAAREMRRIQRRLDDRIQRFKDRRYARRRAQRRAILDHTPDREDFDCMCLCGTCGYFLDDLAETPTSRCPSCDEEDWLDLAFRPVADRLRDFEAQERMEAPPIVRRAVVAASLFGLGCAALAFHLFASADTAYTLVLATFVASFAVVPIAYYMLSAPVSVMLLRNRTRTPDRWRVPLPLPAPDAVARQTFEGQTPRGSGTLVAPVSGRECIAYQVTVLFDARGDARPPEWVLQEQRAVDLRIGELEVPASRVYLEATAERVDAPRVRWDEELAEPERLTAITRFLRQRGLYISDGEFEFYEAVLEPGDLVDVATYDGGVTVLRRCRA